MRKSILLTILFLTVACSGTKVPSPETELVRTNLEIEKFDIDPTGLPRDFSSEVDLCFGGVSVEYVAPNGQSFTNFFASENPTQFVRLDPANGTPLLGFDLPVESIIQAVTLAFFDRCGQGAARVQGSLGNFETPVDSEYTLRYDGLNQVAGEVKIAVNGELDLNRTPTVQSNLELEQAMLRQFLANQEANTDPEGEPFTNPDIIGVEIPPSLGDFVN